MSTKKPSFLHRLTQRIKSDNEKGARESVIEDLFNDFNRSRVNVYHMNFVRGIFFGAGTVIGGTVVIAIIVWLLSLLSHVFPPLGQFFDGVAHLLESPRR